MPWGSIPDPESLAIDFPGPGQWYFGTKLPQELIDAGYVAAEVIWVTDTYEALSVAYLFRGYRPTNSAGYNTLYYEVGICSVWSTPTTRTLTVFDSSLPLYGGYSQRQLTSFLTLGSVEAKSLLIGGNGFPGSFRVYGDVQHQQGTVSFEGMVSIFGNIAISGTATADRANVAKLGSASGSGHIDGYQPIVDVGATVDVWQYGIVTGITLNGVSGVQLDWAYRMTYDRTVDLRVMFTFPSAPASQQIVYAMPAAIPRPDPIPGVNVELAYPALNAAAHTGNLRTPIGCRWATTGNLIFHGPSTGGTATVIKATGTYTVAKP